MTKSLHRVLIVLKLPERIPALLGVSRRIVASMTGNSYFPSPTPSLATVGAAVEALSAAQVDVLARTRGKAALRDEKLGVLVKLLPRLRAYVQGVADDNPEIAGTIIESAGMRIKGRATPRKPPFAVTHGPVSGSVRLAARAAAKEAAYEWQVSSDGGKTWQTDHKTLQASTVITGLTAGRTYWFRYRVLMRKVGMNWSDALSILVK